MKSLTAAVLSVMFLMVLVGAAAAQSTSPAPGSTPSTPQTSPSPAPPSSTTNIDQSNRDSSTTVTTPGARETKPDVKVDVKTERRDDGGAASPRTTGDTRIFGLSPTAAALVGAAILVIAILAIASMSRGGSRTDTHVDIDRKL